MSEQVVKIVLYLLSDNCGDYCQNYEENYLSFTSPGIGRGLTFMACQSVIAFSLLFFLESGTSRRIWQSIVAGILSPQQVPTDEATEMSLARQKSHLEEDNDVRAERERILEMPLELLQQTDSIILSDLQKYYGALLAVNRLSVGIKQGECFGLLGVNGAGKTTTFKMITGDETVSSGNAWLEGYNVNSEIKEVYNDMHIIIGDSCCLYESIQQNAETGSVNSGSVPCHGM